MDQQMEMPHFFPLVIVISSLSIDPACLNLTQKYLDSYAVSFFVICTLEAPKSKKATF